LVHREDFTFPHGIPAFEQHRGFHRAADPAVAPLVVLRCPEPTPLRLICLPLEWIQPDYRLDLPPQEVEALGGAEHLELLAVLTFPPEGSPTANLLAPVVLNHSTGRGVQSIQFESSYPAALPLPGERSGACS
jgi:flagellar assembly factor FliW